MLFLFVKIFKFCIKHYTDIGENYINIKLVHVKCYNILGFIFNGREKFPNTKKVVSLIDSGLATLVLDAKVDYKGNK